MVNPYSSQERCFSYDTLRDTSSVSQQGSVMIFIAFAILPLLLLIWMAIDSSRLSTSHTQMQRTASAMSLAALEIFQSKAQEASPVLTYSQLVAAALNRAAEVGGLTSNELLLSNGQGQLSPGELYDPQTMLGENKAGTLRFGKWWYEAPIIVLVDGTTGGCGSWAPPDNGPYDNSCPCPLIGGSRSWNGPCFEENSNITQAGIEKVTSVQLALKTPETNQLSTFMTVVAGAGKSKLEVKATASLVPRNGIFLIDMSRSTAFQTHLPYEQQLPANRNLSSEVFFPIDYTNPWPNAVSGWSTMAGTESANLCTNRNIGAPGNPTHCPVSPISDDAWTVYNSFIAPRGNRPGGAPLPPTVHYGDDYQYFNVAYNEPSGASTNIGALIDVRFQNTGNPATSYRGPEPLITILSGIHAAVEEVKARSVAGDRLGLIAFDQQANMAIRTFPPERPGEGSFQNLETLTTTDVEFLGPERLPNYRARRLFVPRGDARTDIPEALLKAAELLSDLPNFQTAENFVALFSDGLSNCRHCDTCPATTTQPMLTPSNELNPDECEYPAWAPRLNFPMPKTNQEFQALPAIPGNNLQGLVRDVRQIKGMVYYHSVLEARALLSGATALTAFPSNVINWNVLPEGFPTYVDLNIAFHMFLFGDAVGPNTLIAPNPQGSGCIDDESARQQKLPFAGAEFADNWDEVTDSNAARTGTGAVSNFFDIGQAGSAYRFYMPNRWYYEDGVRPTGGIWAPIRPACPASSCANLGTRLDGACNQLATSAWTDPLTSIPELNGYVTQQFELGSDGSFNPRWLLLCDMQCRTPEQQVRDNIRKIFNQNPYVIVD